MQRTFILLIALLFAISFTPPARGWPPMICHQIDIGDAKSIPWGKDTFDKGDSYDPRSVPGDVLGILTPETPILVRMETLRRASLHVQNHPAIAHTLLGRLMARVIDYEAAGSPNALAYFDAGYLAGCYHQLGVETSFGPSLDARQPDQRGPTGYGWVARAIELAGDGRNAPAMHVAAVLIIGDGRDTLQNEHLRAALAAGVGGAKSKDAKAERDLLEWIAAFNGKTLDSLRAELGIASADADGDR